MRVGRRLAAALLVWGVVAANAQEPAEKPGEKPAGETANATIDGTVLDGITFVAEPGTLYLPVRELAEHLGWSVHWDAEKATVLLKDQPISAEDTRSLLEGTTLIPLRVAEKRGVGLGWDSSRGAARVTAGDRELHVRNGAKRVAVNRAEQKLRGWQGERLVMETRVSTGRRGHETPLGTFTAGPYRARRHFSSLYENAPMPYSVQINGNIFFHGFTSVPPRAASHGCIRLPLTGRNPARWLYRWLDNGSAVVIADGWPETAPASE